MLCSQPNRGALRRQACVEPQAQEQLGDPWVRLSDHSTEETPCLPLSDRVRTQTHVGATMSTEQIITGLDSAITIEAEEATPDVTPENPQPASLSKKGPPVAPKPTWFRHSKKKTQEEQQQKTNLDKTPEQKPLGIFSRGLRSASHGANLSLKQRIHSFETFSSPTSQDRENRRPWATSYSTPQGGKESRRHLGSHDWKELPKEKRNVTAPLKETDEILSKPKVPASNTPTSEAAITSFESDQSPVDLSGDLPPEVPSSGPLSDPSYDDSSTFLSEQKSELSEKSCSSPDTTVVSPEPPVAPSQPEENCSLEEGNAKQLPAVPEDVQHSQNDLDGENKILSFSHEVMCCSLTAF